MPIEYEDFLNYCIIAGKLFSDEITPVDYVAYRSQFGRDRNEVKRIRSIIEAGVKLDQSETGAEATPVISAEEDELSTAGTEIPIEASSSIAETVVVTVDDAELNPAIDAADNTSALRCIAENSKRTYADILGLRAEDYADIALETDFYSRYSVSLSVQSLTHIKKNGYSTLKKLLLLTPKKLCR